MKRMLLLLICIVGLGLVAAGCGGGNTPPKGSRGDSSATVQRYIDTLNNREAKDEARAAAAIQLGNLKAQEALADLERVAADDENEKLREVAAKAVRKIKGEE